jgi:hypothetical protein
MGNILTDIHEDMIRMTRMVDKPFPPSPPPLVAPPADVSNDFWYIELDIANNATMRMNFVFLNYSYSKNRIPLPMTNLTVILAAPYVWVDPNPPYNPNHALADPWADDPTGSGPNFTTALDGSYYNVNWLVANEFFYSFTEDWNGNGRIDRIRAQAAFDLSGGADSFSNFKVAVEGYEIDTTEGPYGNGFVRADEDTNTPATTAAARDGKKDMIYIYLKEKDYADTNAEITWWVTVNTTLKDLTTKSIEIDTPTGKRRTTNDNAPPRINYALTVPDAVYRRPGLFPSSGDLGEIYVQFSEPVDRDSLDPVTTTPVTAYDTAAGIRALDLDTEGRGTEFLIPLTPISPDNKSPYDVSALLSPPDFILTKVQDTAKYAFDKRSDPNELYAYQYPSPKYPTDWSYKDYTEITGNPAEGIDFDTVKPPHGFGYVPETVPRRDPSATPPDKGNKVIEPAKRTHRVTDLLISVPPTETSDVDYFVWPLWAKYNVSPFDGSALPNPDGILGGYVNPGHGFMNPDSSSVYSDRDIIWDFTGKRFLEASSIASGQSYDTTMQIRYRGAAPDSLAYAFNIDSYYKARARTNNNGHGSPGLWLPEPSLPIVDYSNVASHLFPVISLGPQPPSGAVGANLRNYNFTVGSDGYENNRVLEFFFHFSGADIYAGRLDMDARAPVPNDWYYRVRPFSFGIHNITRQRNNATILNNVINPGKGERAYLDYTIASSGQVTIQVFTLDGNLVQVLERGNKAAGNYRVSWDGRNRGGRPVARGMYFVRIVAPDIDEIRKVMGVK